MSWLATVVNLGGSALLAFLGSFAGSYVASWRASKRVAVEEERRLGVDPDQNGQRWQ